ncbi:Putative CBS and PB1 domain-containing protein [Rhizopus microsporus]|nr:Putative CBS and PB1 domain-containing protein [Rhizopus microsporus]
MSTKRAGSRIPSVASFRDNSSELVNTGSRQRQSKRDEAIRKKLEQELSKKSGSKRVRQTKKIAGTVSALRPSQALTVKENMLVIEASQLMAAKRSDCVLVVDEDDHLSGIFTAKDLAYRVVAESLDARDTTVAKIMTKGPMCVTSDTSATDALNLMVSRGFRHLPVCNEEGDIFGLLDITKCLYEALDKMERAFGSSRKLYDALEGVEKEWSNSPIQLVQYMEALRDKMECPDINSVLDGLPPAEVSVKTNVRDVARMMKEYHTTAVLVNDREGLAGIFTTKDIVLRVIAAGLNPENCSVVRVMTPHPDTAPPSMTIMDALRKMHGNDDK